MAAHGEIATVVELKSIRMWIVTVLVFKLIDVLVYVRLIGVEVRELDDGV